MRFVIGLILIIFLIQCKNMHRKTARELNDEALNSLQEGKEKEAIYSFNKALESNGISNEDKTQYLRNIAVAYKQLLFEDTIANSILRDSVRYYYLRAAGINKDTSVQYLLNMADVFIIDKKIAEAINYLEKAWNKDNNELAVNNVLGLIYLGENGEDYFNPEKALKYNLKVEKLNPGRISKYVVAKNYYYLKDYQKAEYEFRDLYNKYPRFPEYLELVITTEKKQGKEDSAKNDLNKLQQDAPEIYKAYNSSMSSK